MRVAIKFTELKTPFRPYMGVRRQRSTSVYPALAFGSTTRQREQKLYS